MTARIWEVLTPDEEAEQADIKSSICRHRSESKWPDAFFQGHHRIRRHLRLRLGGREVVMLLLTTQKMENAIVFTVSLYESLTKQNGAP